MNPKIISLNSKPTPQTTPEQPKPVTPTPKLLDRTEFPTETPKGTRPAKREPGHGELGENRRSVRRTPRSAKPEFTPKTRTSETPQTSQPRTPRISAELERRFRNLELRQKNLVKQARKRGELEYLAVSKNEAGRYWITVAGTGKLFVRESFATAEVCFNGCIDAERRIVDDKLRWSLTYDYG